MSIYQYPGDRRKTGTMISDPLRSQPISAREQRQRNLLQQRQQKQPRRNSDSASSPKSSILSSLGERLKRPLRRPTDPLEMVISNMSPPPQIESTSRSRPRSHSVPNLEEMVCAHPIHYHSFTRPSSVLSFVRSRFRTCAKCKQLLVNRGGTDDSNNNGGGGIGGIVSTADILVCLACGVFVHRACGIGSCNGEGGGNGRWMDVCEVNRKLIQRRSDIWDAVEKEEKRGMEKENEEVNEDGDTVWSEDGPPAHWAISSPGALQGLKPTTVGKDDVEEEEEEEEEETVVTTKLFEVSFAGMSRALQENILANWLKGSSGSTIDGSETEEGDVSIVSKNLRDHCRIDGGGQDSNSDGILSGFPNDNNEMDTTGVTKKEKRGSIMENSVAVMEEISNNIKSLPSTDPPTESCHDDEKTQTDTLLTHTEPKPSPPPEPTAATKLKSTFQTIKQTKTLLQKTASAPKTVAVASLVGGIAGGVVGLLVAGPAGAYAGSNIGRVAVVAGVAVEGSIVMAGVAGGVMKRRKEGGGGEGVGGGKRILAIGEKGTVQKVVLVRPNVVVDPIWEEVTSEARRLALIAMDVPGKGIGGIKGLVKRNIGGSAVDARARRLRDVDIAKADEGEIGTAEKVMLLVSSSLNDKTSLPGHVYRHLIREHQNRERERRRLRWEEDMVVLVDEGDESDNSNEDGTEGDACRTTREDTHAVIKHITATLLEVRPGFGASARITEMSATAVEALVFGEVYNLVFGEIIDETRGIDEALMIKISEFQIEVGRSLSFDSISESSTSSNSCSSGLTTSKKTIMVPTCDIEEFVSDDALKCLRMMPESHTVAEKLFHCVQFLGFIASSSQFQTTTNENQPNSKVQGEKKKKTSMGADALLKMVCQHIIVAKVPNLNAEIVFLEEFARDEQLLKGREGYALVTMQASLHFMNSSIDFGRDIFHDEDD